MSLTPTEASWLLIRTAQENESIAGYQRLERLKRLTSGAWVSYEALDPDIVQRQRRRRARK